MSRSKWKVPYLPQSVIKKTDTTNIWTRNSIIPSFFFDFFINIYNGKEHKQIRVNHEKIGFKFGEFVFTRKGYMYKGKKKILKKKK